jgi:hypothetical protein
MSGYLYQPKPNDPGALRKLGKKLVQNSIHPRYSRTIQPEIKYLLAQNLETPARLDLSFARIRLYHQQQFMYCWAPFSSFPFDEKLWSGRGAPHGHSFSSFPSLESDRFFWFTEFSSCFSSFSFLKRTATVLSLTCVVFPSSLNIYHL